MQPYDFLMIAILAGLTLHGYSKGMAWQVAYLGSLIASYFVALRFADQFAPMFGATAPFNKFVAMLVIYIACSFAIWMLFRVVRGAIDKVKMEGFDHQMGALIGLARGALWCVGITFFAVTLLPQGQKESILATRSGRTIAEALDKTDAIVPPEVHEVIGPLIHKIEQRLNPGAAPHAAGSPQPYWPGQPPTQAGGAWPGAPQASGAVPSAPQQSGWPNPGGAAWPQAAPAGTPASPASWPNANP